ncbi:hypothetical protein D3C87_103450 [compost metagenome]
MFSLSQFGRVICGFILALIFSACGPVKFSSQTIDDGSNEPAGPNPGGPVVTFRDVHYNGNATTVSNKLDIVLVVDDSKSMLADNQKLAGKLGNFVSRLQTSAIDWQMCTTATRDLLVSGNRVWGASIFWQNYSGNPGYILRSGTSDLSTIFTSTINYIGAGWANSDDERGIKAAYRHVYNGDYNFQGVSGCYRPDAAIAFIIISDEDERSIGGDLSQKYYSNEGLSLEDEDKPQYFVDFVKTSFGAMKRFTVNSIIVKPGDTACMAEQDAGGSKGHYGFRYAELSALTGGGVASICAPDFADSLNLFFDHIKDSLKSLPLECAPANGDIAVTVSPSMTVSSRLEGASLVFDTPIPAGYNVDLKYKCPVDTRNPSSAEGATAYEGPGFFTRIINFFKSLF